MKKCLLKLNSELKGFNTREVLDAAAEYVKRRLDPKQADIAAIKDHLKEIDRQINSAQATVLQEWKKRDPEGYAGATKPLIAKADKPTVNKPAEDVVEVHPAKEADKPVDKEPDQITKPQTPNKEQDQNAPDTDGPRYKRTSQASQTAGLSNPEAKKELTAAFGAKAVESLDKQGLLNFTRTTNDWPQYLQAGLNGTESAVYHNGKAYYALDNIPSGQIVSRVLHEIGEHHGLEYMLGEKAYANLMKRIKTMRDLKSVAVNAAWNSVERKYANLRPGSPQFISEVLARLGENQKVQKSSWWVDLKERIQAFLLKIGLNRDWVKNISTDDINLLIRASVLSVSRENKPSVIDGTAQPAHSRTSQTETEAFRKWFGKSAVVDSDGKPLVMYHGTYGDFTRFKKRTGDIGLHFGDAATASDRMDTAVPHRGNKDGQTLSANVMPVYLSIKNPIRLKDHGFWNVENMAYKLREMFPQDAEKIGNGYSKRSGLQSTKDIREFLQSKGFDGVVYKNTGEVAGSAPFRKRLEAAREAKNQVFPKGKNSFDLADQQVPEYKAWTAAQQAYEEHREAEGTDSYIAFESTQIKSATGNNGQFSPTNPDIRYSRQDPLDLQGGSNGKTGWDAPISTGLDNIAYKLQDKHIDMKRVIQSIKEAGGTIQDKYDPYLQEELFHKRAAKRTEDFVDRELNPLLKDAALRGLTLDEIDRYLHARHAEEANKLAAERNPDAEGLQDGGSGMKTADAKAYLSGLEAGKRKHLEAAAAKVDAMIATTRGLYVSYGLESANTVQGWAEMFENYVPLMREDHDGGMGTGQGFSIKGREVKHRTGSTAKVIDILANIALQREKVVVRGEKNRVAVALAGLAKLNPNNDFWKVGKAPTEKVLNEKTGVVETRSDPMFKSRENAVVAKIPDGKGGVQEIAVLFNEDNERAMRMAAALKNLDAAQLEGIIGISAIITRYFASINTQYNPVFGVVNLVRDYQGAILNLTSTPLAKHKAKVMNPLAVMSALKGIYLDTRAERKGGAATSEWAQLWEEFNLEGGTTGFRDLFRTSTDRADAIERTLNPTKWMESGLGKIFTAGGTLKAPMAFAQKKAGWLFDWISDYNLAMENAVRLSAYKVALDQGMSKQRAASLAKRLTVNFNRKGSVGQQAGALYAFFNASMQGSARMAETLTTMDKGDIKTLRLSKTGAVIIGGGVFLGSMQALMLAAAGFGEDEPPEFVRERNLIIPIGGKKYITIPMPLGYHVLPNLGRVPTELMLRGGRDAGSHVLNLIGTVIGAFNPTGSAGMSWQTVMPTPIDPAMALTENKDWTGKPIARQSYNKATPGHALAKDTATHPGRWIAEAVNYVTGGGKYTRGYFSPTPDQVDYLGAQLGGGVLRELGKVNQSVSATITGEELPPHKVPLAGRFYGDAEGSSSQGNIFYKNVERLNKIEAEIKGRQQDGVPTMEYKAKHPEAILIKEANDAERKVSELRKEKRKLVEDDAPPERVKALETRITARMKFLNDRVERLRQQAGAGQR